LFVVLEGYLQYQYGLFGNRYGLATVLPALVFLPLAYWFDHRGVLAMGLTALASWVGLTVAPLAVLTQNHFWSYQIRLAATGLGMVLMAAGFYSEYDQRKPHFAFTYLLLGSNLALAALATSLVKTAFDEMLAASLGTALVMPALCAGLFWYARRVQSYWFLVLAAGYGYFAAWCVLAQLVMCLPQELIMGTSSIAFPLSALLVVVFFAKPKTILHGPTTPTPPPAAPHP
jgi:hypothetical protein